MRLAAGLVVSVGVWAAGAIAARADDISDKLDAARGAYARADALRALEALQAAETALTARLTDQFAKALPPPPAGWEASPPDSQPLDAIGGGITITRGYQKGEAALNAELIVDNPAVGNAQALFAPTGPAGGAGWKSVKIGGEDALLRFDAANKDGEIVITLLGRAALQIEGSEIASDQPLTDLAQGWNLTLLKKLLVP